MKNQKGFTILELLIVVWVLIVLTAIGGLVFAACHVLI